MQPLQMKRTFSEKPRPNVSVVILNFNAGTTFLEKCLRSVLNSNYPFLEVLFVDNASTDDSVNYVRRHFSHDPRLKIIINSQNLGYTAGNNVGITAAKGDYVALLNPDTEVSVDWLDGIVDLMQSDDLISAVQPKILLMVDRSRVLSRGNNVDYCGFGYVDGFLSEDTVNNEDNYEIFYADGAAAVFSKESLQKVGLLDPEYFFYYDTLDLCWRMWLAGYKVFYVSSSKVYHWGGTALWKVPDSRLNYYNKRNQLWTLLKNLQLRNVILYYPLTLFFITVISLYHRRSKMVLSTMRAISHTLLRFKIIWIKRLSVQMLRTRSDREIKSFGIIEPSGSFAKTGFLFLRAAGKTMKSIVKKMQDATETAK